jgi:hypothetical protein
MPTIRYLSIRGKQPQMNADKGRRESAFICGEIKTNILREGNGLRYEDFKLCRNRPRKLLIPLMGQFHFLTELTHHQRAS